VYALAFRRLGSELSFPDRFLYPACTPAFAAYGLFAFGAFSDEEVGMADDAIAVQRATGKRGLTLDWWAVLLALVLAVLVRAGVLQNISW
jgi:high-affinity Fe2+/Pb2+ permease